MPLFSNRLPGWARRAALPFGFALAVTGGSAMLMRGAISVSETKAPEPLAQLVLPPPSAALQSAEHGGHPAPTYVRAIESDAVFVAQKAKKPLENHKVAEVSPTLPAGVERFDKCSGDCDTRDPLIVPVTYSIVTPPTPLAAQKEDNALFSLPKFEDGAALIDRAKEATASATTSVVDAARQAVTSVGDFAAGLVR